MGIVCHSRMIRIITVLCLVGATIAFMGKEEMLKKYAYSKIMSSCMGEEFVMNWKMEMKAACDKCKGQDIEQTMIDIQAMLKQLRKNYSPFTRQTQQQQPIYVPVPVYMNQQPQFPQLSAFRAKRSMDWDLSPEGIEKMKEKMMAKISNVTCVLKEMKCMTADNQPNYEYYNQQVNELTVDEALKEDLREAMDMCRDFALCMPVEKANTPFKKELGTTLAFMKCIHMKRAMVCMKHDMKKYAPMLGFEGDVNMLDEVMTMLTEEPELM